MAGTQQFSNSHSPFVVLVDGVGLAVANTVHAEVEAVKVHGMDDTSSIDHTPVHGLADAIRQAFRVRPGKTVDFPEVVHHQG